MLKGISPCISPALLETLARMGHGDEIVFADAHFPGETYNPKVIRCDGIRIPALLEGVMPLFELDNYVEAPLIMMAPAEGDFLDPVVEESFMTAIRKFCPATPPVQRIGRFEFYQRTRLAFAVVDRKSVV